MSVWVHQLQQMYHLVEDVDCGGSYVCGGKRVYRKSLHLPLNFALKLKLLKNKSTKLFYTYVGPLTQHRIARTMS